MLSFWEPEGRGGCRIPPMCDDPHSILGVLPSASVSQIRTAFRRLALLHHPDRNPGDGRAHERFKRILCAYRSALAQVGRRAEARRMPTGPRPDRYGCGRCGDTFPFPESCSRCGIELFDRSVAPAPEVVDPRVSALIARLETRSAPSTDWEEQVPVPGLLVAGCLSAAALVWTVGPVGLAILFLGFAMYVTGIELHRRARA